MGQQVGAVYFYKWRHHTRNQVIYPWLDCEMTSFKGRIYGRSKALERAVDRGERLIKLDDGWFSTKAILVA
jgi:hypothetical protein